MDDFVDDSGFIREVYDASYRRLVGQLVGITGSRLEAEEVVQEAFVRALGKARAFRRMDNPEAWLRTVAVNISRSRWRRVKHLAGLTPKLVTGQTPATSYDESSADRLAIEAALRKLPASQREAIALHHIADLSINEVATTLGVPTGTVKARLSRGRAAMAVLLQEPADNLGANHV